MLKMWKNRSTLDIALDILIYVILTFTAITTLYPFLNILAISFNDSVDTVKGGIYLIPRKFTLENYRAVFGVSNLLNSFYISVLRTVIGTVTGLLCTTMLAYTLSRKDFPARKLFTTLFIIIMYISGGMIPEFMLVRKLGLMNKFMVYIAPNLIIAWYLFLIRSYIETLPGDLQESAKLDGANDFVIFARIIVPLCGPILATVALFIAVGQWNSWLDTYLYAGGSKKLSTLQFELMKIMETAQSQVSNARMAQQQGSATARYISPKSIKMAITVVATVPILVVYPFLQKYFVTGLTLGSVKS